MPADTTPLAQRLRDIAGRIASDSARKWFHPPAFGPTERQVGGEIAAALLRELADHGAAIEDHGGDWQSMLRCLADSIEKGGQDNGQ